MQNNCADPGGGQRRTGLSRREKPMDENSANDGRRAAGGDSACGDETGRAHPARRRNVLWLLAATIVVTVVAGYTVWRFTGRQATTEDAYVEATNAFVSPRIAGRVEAVLVAGDRHVEVGDLLVKLDAGDQRIAVTHAEAEVTRAQSRLQAARVAVDYNREVTGARVREAEARRAAAEQTLELANTDLARRRAEARAATADRDQARQDLERLRTLWHKGGVARRELDHGLAGEQVMSARLDVAVAAVTAQEQQVKATEQQLEAARAQLAEARADDLSTRMRSLDADTLAAELVQAEAELAQARRDLEYTEIRAPISGFVSRKSVEVGNYAEPGQALMAIVPLDRVWVEANFKEDQLDLIRVGQPATIVADTYPDHTFRGHVDSLGSGTGDAFSLLPPVNATGNWIKVTRRVPVKIVLEAPPPAEYPLRIGMSTTVTVDTRDQSGSRLAMAGDASGTTGAPPRRQR